MKRSEMIDKIKETLTGRPFPQGDDWAEQLLNLMEELGMAPPETVILKEHYDRSTGNYGYVVHEWEEDYETE